MTSYRITLSAQQRLDRIDKNVAELDRQIAENNKQMADLEQKNQALLEVRAITLEYAAAVKADGMR